MKKMITRRQFMAAAGVVAAASALTACGGSSASTAASSAAGSAAASGRDRVRADRSAVLILDRIGHIHKSVICAVKCGILVHKLLQIDRIAR